LILTGVIEHIRDLEGAVESFKRLLASGGRIYLEVPDAGRLAPEMDAPFQEFSVEHINYFSSGSLNNLMTLRGFRVVANGHALRRTPSTTANTTWGVYEKNEGAPVFQRDEETAAGLRAYIAGCTERDAQIREKIRHELPPHGRIIVWGVGAHTLRLLASGGLDAARVSAFVDSNPKYQNRELRGIPVISPGDVRERTEPILISSQGCQQEIQRQIRDQLEMVNRLILLYGQAEACPTYNCE
jgi:hypothetical protein